MYTDQKAPESIRGQAQSLLVFLTQGVGMFFGYRIMDGGSLGPIPLNLTFGDYGSKVTNAEEYAQALVAARGETEPLGFLQTFGEMLSSSLPEEILGSELLTTTMGQWKNFWMSPAIMAAIILV